MGLVNDHIYHIAGWKTTIFNRRYIDSFRVDFPASDVIGKTGGFWWPPIHRDLWLVLFYSRGTGLKVLTNQHLPSSRSLVFHTGWGCSKKGVVPWEKCVVLWCMVLLLSSLSLLLLLVGGGAGADCNFEDTLVVKSINKWVAVAASLMNLSDIEFIDVNTLKLTASLPWKYRPSQKDTSIPTIIF